ncbi:MAG: hypothetical protein RLZZ234_424 [Candidatus Parcubacteria bacterium]|jgi:hypothetical protein
MEILCLITDFIFGYDFQVSFWSGIAMSAVVGFVVYQYTDVFKSPNLVFVVKQNGLYRDTIQLTKDGKKYEARFQFAIKNIGNKAIKHNEGYWHLYLDVKNPTIFSAPEEINHSRGQINGTIYPSSFFDIGLVYELEINEENLSKAEIPYFFSTDYGQFPETAVINQETGEVLWKDMGYIKFEVPKI